jgi:hypothetical protein
MKLAQQISELSAEVSALRERLGRYLSGEDSRAQAAPPGRCSGAAEGSKGGAVQCTGPRGHAGTHRESWVAATPVQGAPPLPFDNVTSSGEAYLAAHGAAPAARAAAGRDCIHGRRTCEPCAWTAGYPRELLQGGAVVWKLRDFDGEQWRDVPAGGPTCAAGCGTKLRIDLAHDAGWKWWKLGTCFCSWGCYEAGHSLRPAPAVPEPVRESNLGLAPSHAASPPGGKANAVEAICGPDLGPTRAG